MNGDSPQSQSDRSSVAGFIVMGTLVWFLNPFPFFGLGPLQMFVPDEYYLRTLNQLKQAGMLHLFSRVFICVEIQAILLLALAVVALVRRNVKLSVAYMVIIIVCTILPWLRFFSDLGHALKPLHTVPSGANPPARLSGACNLGGVTAAASGASFARRVSISR